jgi:adenylate kinase
MKISLIGPPGSGKSTLAQYLSEVYSVAIISAGYIIRNVKIYPWVRDIIGDYDVYSGELLSDDKLIRIMTLALQSRQRGWILDGIPRQVGQCQAMMESFKPDMIIILKAPLDLIIERLSGRLYHPSSGRIYHITKRPPKVEGLDDITREPLIRRDDDAPEIITKRHRIYLSSTLEMIQYLRDHHTDVPIIDVTVDRLDTPESIGQDVIFRYQKNLIESFDAGFQE